MSYESKPFCEIRRAHGTARRIYPTFSDAMWAGSPENINNLFEALSTAIYAKARLLETQRVKKPWVLLFGDGYPFASPKLYMEKVRPLMGDMQNIFHSIFVILPTGESFMFCSQAKQWAKE